MRRTRHFAGVIGAAGIVVSPFMAPLAAQADDTLPTDTLDYAVEGDANGTGDVPNLPVTRVVASEDSATDSEATNAAEDSVTSVGSDDEFLTPVVSKRAAALDIVETDNGVVLLDVPDEVKEGLAASGEISGDVLKGFIVEGSEIGMEGVTFEFDGMNWTMVAPAAEDEADDAASQPVAKQPVAKPVVVSQDVADRLNAYVAQRNAGNVVAAPSTVGVAAPVAENGTDSTDSVVDNVAPAPREAAPQLPVTGDDAAGASSTEDSLLPLAPLLGITGLVLGGGIGVVTLRKRLEFADSK